MKNPNARFWKQENQSHGLALLSFLRSNKRRGEHGGTIQILWKPRDGRGQTFNCLEVNSGRTEKASHNLAPFAFETQIFSGTHWTGFFNILDTVSQSHNSCILVFEEESREKQETMGPHCRNLKEEPKES
jgi:hypothetical protein